MAQSSNAQSNDRYRRELLNKLMEFLKSEEGGQEWVMQVASNSFGFPFVNDEGNDEIAKITISIPKGSRDGEPYDLDTEAKSYAIDCKEKEEKRKKAEELKAKKIAQDKKRRETMAKLKKEREEKGE